MEKLLRYYLLVRINISSTFRIRHNINSSIYNLQRFIKYFILLNNSIQSKNSITHRIDQFNSSNKHSKILGLGRPGRWSPIDEILDFKNLTPVS